MWTTIFSNTLHATLEILFPTKCLSCRNNGAVICSHCLQKIPKAVDTPYTWIHTLYSYKNKAIKKGIHSMKYFHRKDIARFFGERIALSILEEHRTYTLLPVPMQTTRRLIRGHNHTLSIAKALQAQTNLPIDTRLVTVEKNHRRQVLTRTRKERYRNKRGVFRVTSSIKDTSYIIIDDVTTTGATLLEIRKLLLEHGARDVVAYTIAH